RAELHLPPAWRAARLDGARAGIEALFDRARTAGFEVLGPVPVPRRDSSPEPPTLRGLVRAPLDRGRELAAFLRLQAREASVRREESVRIELDPTVLW
ncbi:primosomal protein N', partial [Actinomyces sp. MRS3W]|nr:primosomal protein N' [Actinomyces sp. MRS3W]